MTFPTPDKITLAIATACSLTGEDPVACVQGERGIRARHVAYAALSEVYKKAGRSALAEKLGYAIPRNCMIQTIRARNQQWWNDVWVDEVVGALVADEYGEQAA